MASVVKGESQMSSSRTLVLPDVFTIEICITPLNTPFRLENGGAEIVNIPAIQRDGTDGVVLANNKVQNPN